MIPSWDPPIISLDSAARLAGSLFFFSLFSLSNKSDAFQLLCLIPLTDLISGAILTLSNIEHTFDFSTGNDVNRVCEFAL